MEKQRLFKMSSTEQNMLVKALCDVRQERQPEESGTLGAFNLTIDKGYTVKTRHKKTAFWRVAL